MLLQEDSRNPSAFLFSFLVLPLRGLSPASQYVLYEALWYLAALFLRPFSPNKLPNLESTLWKVDSTIVHCHFQWLTVKHTAAARSHGALVIILQSDIYLNVPMKESREKIDREGCEG